VSFFDAGSYYETSRLQVGRGLPHGSGSAGTTIPASGGFASTWRAAAADKETQ
jgi:hypothetical protein